ncbi:hypothetical protein XENTR_v10017192 [Xenopus tropicalis]|nr:hypothetical protein XENTR_v10017192 [Xenopus tropicalis]
MLLMSHWLGITALNGDTQNSGFDQHILPFLAGFGFCQIHATGQIRILIRFSIQPNLLQRIRCSASS